MTASRRSFLVSGALVVALAALAAVFHRPLVAWFRGPPSVAAATSANPASGAAIDHYTCSMHPSVRQAGPGKCPICGMDLIPVTKAQEEAGVVMIDEARRQLIGVRTAPVVKAPLHTTIRAVGRVALDESGLADVSPKVRGWITKLAVSKTGERVSRGQPLFTMYSPDLYNAQQDFLLATAPHDGGAFHSDALARAARQRLDLLGMDSAEIDAVAAKRVPAESITVSSPASGFVIEKNVVEGSSVDAGMRLYRIATLDRVWIEADVYESDFASVRSGQSVRVTLDYLAGHVYEAKVAYVYPYLDPKTRTGRVRIELINKDLELRPGMYANVELATDRGARVQVPVSAVVYTGPRRLVFVDLGDGRFEPREIRIGSEASGMYEVLSGLEPGDLVATSGVFLIAAEARISTSAPYWDNAPTPADAGAVTVAPPVIKPRTAAPADAAIPTTYSCPMHPEVQSPAPGKCPKCGMDLEPVKKP